MLLPTEAELAEIAPPPTGACSMCGRVWPVARMYDAGAGVRLCPTSTETNPHEAGDCFNRLLAQRERNLSGQPAPAVAAESAPEPSAPGAGTDTPGDSPAAGDDGQDAEPNGDGQDVLPDGGDR